MKVSSLQAAARLRKAALGAALALGMLAGPNGAHAQSAIIYGSVGNFDISNDTGRICHGFEVDLDGQTTVLPPSASFAANRYGTPSSFLYTGGAAVRWESPYDPSTQTFAERTLPHTVPWFPGQCYQWNPATYQDSGCEHFGTARVGAGSITSMTARWLCEDPANPGTLAPVDPPTAVPYPSYYVQPPAQPNLPPQVVIVIPPPLPPPPPQPVPQYGDASWIRVFVTEFPREVNLNELVADNPAVVPMDPAQIESSWDLVQADPPGVPEGKHSRKRNGRDLKPTTRSVVRRIETWAFIGDYDPINHIAICADGTCTAPAADEVGLLVSTQMVAVNVQEDSLTITKSGTGSGNVDSSDKVLSCGSKCVSPYNGGTSVTLTAKAASGSVFSGWTGSCTGTASTCTVAVNGHTDVGATFTVQASSGGGGGGTTSGTTYKISISKNGKGTVTSSPSASAYPAGTVVTLTATPDPGSPWVGWGGACSGTATTCTLTMNTNYSVTANFR
jgi:hypothetical protein